MMLNERLIEELGYDEFLQPPSRTVDSDYLPEKIEGGTKNILRNIGNGIKKNISRNHQARTYVTENTTAPHRFHQWVEHLKLERFEDFQEAWTEGNHLFCRMFRRLCWRFFRDNCHCHIIHSRMRDYTTKKAHIKYLFRFLEGIRDPSTFTYFIKPRE